MASKPKKSSPDLSIFPEDTPPLLSYAEAARLTGISDRTLRRMTARGDLPCYAPKGTKTLRVKTVELAATIQRVA